METTVTRALHRFDQRAKIVVAGEQHDLIDLLGEFQRIDHELDIQLAFDLRRPLASMHSPSPW